jgi:hypothetical protein
VCSSDLAGYGTFQSVALLPSWEDVKPFVAIAAAAVGLNSIAAAIAAPAATATEAAALSIAEAAPAFTPAVDSQLANTVLGLVEPVTAVTAPATWAEVVTQVVTEAVAPVVEAVAPAVDYALPAALDPTTGAIAGDAFMPVALADFGAVPANTATATATAAIEQIVQAVVQPIFEAITQPASTVPGDAFMPGALDPPTGAIAGDAFMPGALADFGAVPANTATATAVAALDALPTGLLSAPAETAATTAATTTAATAATGAAAGVGVLNTIGQVLGIGTAVANLVKPTPGTLAPGGTLPPGATAVPIRKPTTAATADDSLWGLVLAGAAAGYLALS